MFRYSLLIRVPIGFASVAGRLTRREESFRFEVRTLSRSEFEQCRVTTANPAELEEQVLTLAVLARPETFHGEPFDFETVYAGVGHHLVAEILALSGFGEAPHPTILARAGSYLAGEESAYDLLIMTAFNYTLEALLSLDAESWHRLVGLATKKLCLMGIDPTAILDPESHQKQRSHAAGAVASGPVTRERGVERRNEVSTMSFTGS